MQISCFRWLIPSQSARCLLIAALSPEIAPNSERSTHTNKFIRESHMLSVRSGRPTGFWQPAHPPKILTVFLMYALALRRYRSHGGISWRHFTAILSQQSNSEKKKMLRKHIPWIINGEDCAEMPRNSRLGNVATPIKSAIAASVAGNLKLMNGGGWRVEIVSKIIY